MCHPGNYARNIQEIREGAESCNTQIEPSFVNKSDNRICQSQFLTAIVKN